MYDYIRGKFPAPGQAQYTINGVDIYDGKPIDFIPEREYLGAGLLPGEFELTMMLVEGLTMANPEMVPDLDAFVVPEDLDLKIKTSTQPPQSQTLKNCYP